MKDNKRGDSDLDIKSTFHGSESGLLPQSNLLVLLTIAEVSMATVSGGGTESDDVINHMIFMPETSGLKGNNDRH